MPYGDKSAVDTLGLDLRLVVDDLTAKVATLADPTDERVEKLDALRALLSAALYVSARTDNTGGSVSWSVKKASVSRNSDMLHCRLPPFWCSKECVRNAESAVFFFHRVTRSVQWEMPVYPWEANDDDDMDIYDYNMASVVQVSHDEIQQVSGCRR